MNSRNLIRNILLAGIGGGLLTLGATSSAFAADKSPKLIHACVHKNGKVRIVKNTNSCKKGTETYTFALQGPQGDKGQNGKNGKNGKDGTPGPTLTNIGYEAVPPYEFEDPSGTVTLKDIEINGGGFTAPVGPGAEITVAGIFHYSGTDCPDCKLQLGLAPLTEGQDTGDIRCNAVSLASVESGGSQGSFTFTFPVPSEPGAYHLVFDPTNSGSDSCETGGPNTPLDWWHGKPAVPAQAFGVVSVMEGYENNSSEPEDFDTDGIPDSSDNDIDGDGVPNESDEDDYNPAIPGDGDEECGPPENEGDADCDGVPSYDDWDDNDPDIGSTPPG
jgi:hypothetical protein